MKETNLLLKFINDPSAKESDIEQVDSRLFSYKGRYYSVEDLHYTQYGDPWYHKNYWKDYGHYRCSIHMFICRSNPDWNGKCSVSLHVGSEKVYTWKNRTYLCSKKTKNQISALANRYIFKMLNDFNKQDRVPDFDVDTVRKLLVHEFQWMCY